MSTDLIKTASYGGCKPVFDRTELLLEIERLRSELNTLASIKAKYSTILELSRQLDLLIVIYYKFL